jgi:hypothetical protein
MEAEGGEPQAPSYSSVTAKEHDSYHSKRPTFELPEGMQKIHLGGRDVEGKANGN